MVTPQLSYVEWRIIIAKKSKVGNLIKYLTILILSDDTQMYNGILCACMRECMRMCARACVCA